VRLIFEITPQLLESAHEKTAEDPPSEKAPNTGPVRKRR